VHTYVINDDTQAKAFKYKNTYNTQVIVHNVSTQTLQNKL